MLAYASSVMVFVGTIKSMHSNFGAMKEEAEKKLSKCVADLLDSIIDQTKLLSSKSLNKNAIQLPTIFSKLENMSAFEIYQKMLHV